MSKFEKMIKENNDYNFEIQKFIDIASNIENEDLRIRVTAQMIKTQLKLLEILE